MGAEVGRVAQVLVNMLPFCFLSPYSTVTFDYGALLLCRVVVAV